MMFIDVDKIVATWEADEPKYRRLGKGLLPILKNLIYEHEIFPEITYRVKDLLSIIRKLKKKNLNKVYSYDELHDKLGIRVICSFADEMEMLEKVIYENFKVVKADKKKEVLDYNKLDYTSNHYDVSIDASKKMFKRLSLYNDLVFEVQVKTLNQHTWSNTSHALSYKQEANLSEIFKRKVFRLISLYEIADDEFAIVNNALKGDPSNLLYSLLRKTEGKVYKFAHVDFDRDYSLHVLNKLLGYFSIDEKEQLSREIETFISQNEQKIRRIFSENAKRLHKLPFLTQPEIFVIWYALKNFPFSITDQWENDFDLSELEDIRTLWGKDI